MARPFIFAALCERAHPLKHSLAESIFVSRVQKSEKIFVSRKIRQQGHSLAEVSLYLLFSEKNHMHRPKHLSTNVDCGRSQTLVLCTRRSSRSYHKNKEFSSWESEGVTVCMVHDHITSILNTLRADLLGARIPAAVRYFCLLQKRTKPALGSIRAHSEDVLGIFPGDKAVMA